MMRCRPMRIWSRRMVKVKKGLVLVYIRKGPHTSHIDVVDNVKSVFALEEKFEKLW